MKICFLLAEPQLGGGVKVVFQLASIASRLGHEVLVSGLGDKPDWTDGYYRGAYQNRREVHRQEHFDLVIATYYTTLELAERMNADRLVHFCQGYEGNLDHLSAEKTSIEAAYQRPWPLFIVNPRLGRSLQRRFGKRWYLMPPPLDPLFRPSMRLMPRSRPSIAVPGNFEVPCKGVDTCLEAVRQLRREGMEPRILRYSLLPQSEKERRLLPGSDFMHGVSPREISQALRKCDLLLQGSTEAEGFGLPAMEAALSGVPVVCTDLPAMRLIGIPSTARVAVGNHQAMAAAAQAILSSPLKWNSHRIRTWCRVRSRFSDHSLARRLERGLRWLEQSDKIAPRARNA